MQISNVFDNQKNHLSKRVEFNRSSDMYPNHIKASHFWVVPHLDIPDWPHLRNNKQNTNKQPVLIGTATFARRS